MTRTPFHMPRVALRWPKRARSEALMTTQPGPLRTILAANFVGWVEVGVRVWNGGIEVFPLFHFAASEPIPALVRDANGVEQALLGSRPLRSRPQT